jgi:integrating conjugative element membrane protein (TIGR03747 family)
MEQRMRRGVNIGVIGWLVLSPLIALALHIGYAFLVWPDSPADGLHRLSTQEAITVSIVLGERGQLPATVAERAYQLIADPIARAKLTLQQPVASSQSPADQITSMGHQLDRRVMDTLGELFATSAVALWLVALRLGVLLTALPLFCLSAAVGVSDGLMCRYLRRVDAQRESSFLYHRAKGAARFMLVAVCMLYLAVPVSFDPRLLLVPGALAFALALRIAMGYFKKYL